MAATAGIPFRLAPLAGRGRIASSDAMRVRGTLRESNSHRPHGGSPSPQPSPRKRGEGADRNARRQPC
jgi:hypothetical protein